MPIRTTEAQVKNILTTSLTTPQIEAFIADASLWVDEELVNRGLSASRMEMVERYLTCALIRLRDVGVASVSFADVRESYQVDPKVTDYLLRAAALDPSGQVRRFFLAPDDRRTVLFRTGTRFMDEH